MLSGGDLLQKTVLEGRLCQYVRREIGISGKMALTYCGKSS